MKLVINPHILDSAFSHPTPLHEQFTLELYRLCRVANRFREASCKAMAKATGIKIFISYKWVDKDWVGIIKRDLKREGYDIWIDEERMGGGVEWREEIKREINKATIFVSLLSRHACVSDGVFKEELREALVVRGGRGGNFIIPLLHGKVDVPTELGQLNPLRTSDPNWLDNLKEEVAKEAARQREIAVSAEELSKPGICLDDELGKSEIALMYRAMFGSSRKFMEWREKIKKMGGFLFEPPLVSPSLEKDLKSLEARSRDKKGCLEDGGLIFVRVALGATNGHLVCEGGVDGKCRQKHEWDECPTGKLLRKQRQDFVLTANDALLRAQELREALESKIREWQHSSRASKE